jgi:hypothetical protein
MNEVFQKKFVDLCIPLKSGTKETSIHISYCNVTQNMNEDNESKLDQEQPAGSEKYFYYENGLMVFTEAYHLLRGYCCERGCRHCPYGFKKKGNQSFKR